MPVERRRHDVHVLTVSGLEIQLQSKLHVNGGSNFLFCLYIESSYPAREYLLVGFRVSSLSAEETALNKDLSRARVAVEWFFRDVKKYFSHVKTVYKMAVSRCPIVLWHDCGILDAVYTGSQPLSSSTVRLLPFRTMYRCSLSKGQ